MPHPSPTTIASLLDTAPCARSDAELLLAHVCKKDRASIIAYPEHTPTTDQRTRFHELAARRAKGEPLAYLTDTKEFYGRAFRVTPATLIPRPETELLVEHALIHAKKHIRTQKSTPLIIADIGTGSGAIIVTLAAELAAAYATHNCGFVATDTSRDALVIADANARTRDVADQIAFIEANLLTPFLQSESLSRMLRLGAHLLICANLPYVDTAQRATLTARPEGCGLTYEPADALWADDGGLALYKQLFAHITDIVSTAPKAAVTVLCEIDPAQNDTLTAHIRAHFPHTTIKTHADLAGRARVVACTL